MLASINTKDITGIMMYPSSTSLASLERLSIPLSDVETNRAVEEQHVNQAADVLKVVGEWIHHADGALGDLEANSDLVGSSMVRKCQEVADGISHLVGELEQHSEEERNAMALALHNDTRDLLLMEEGRDNTATGNASSSLVPGSDDRHALADITPQDWAQALDTATDLLRDVEAAFRDITKSEADEIADVALTLARLFLLSLDSFHSQLTPDDLVHATASVQQQQTERSSVVIEDLSSDSVNPHPSTPQKDKRETRRNIRRQRVIWPPLGPHMEAACHWGKDAASQQPLLAVALGLTLWPVAIGTALLGGSVVVADHGLQSLYNHVQNQDWMRTVEEGATQAVQAGKLMWLSSKLVGKQSLRVAQRQIDRQGGLDKIAENITQMAVDRALHPVDTIQQSWGGLTHGIGWIHGTVTKALAKHEEEEQAIALQ